MKQISSVLLLFILSTQLNNSYAQGDTFAPVGATWYHDRTGNAGEYWGYTKSTSVKDSVIDGRSCRVINSMTVESYSYYIEIDTVYQEAAMIIYTTPDTVYYLNQYIERFIPLYIFNVNIGDTISYRTPYNIPNHPDFPPEDTIFRILITDIGTTNVSGVPLKTVSYAALDKWGFSWGLDTNGYYIERIGTLTTPLLSHYPITRFVSSGYPPNLRCYTDEDISFKYDDRPCDTVHRLNTSISKSQISHSFQIYPNPAGGYVTIRNAGGNFEVTSVEVYDMIGRKVKTVAFGNTDQEHILSIADLPRGTYTLKIRSKEQVVNRKLMVR